MSNFNKVVTNIPVSLTETEMSNLSQTFSGIIQGGGGGGEGKRYIGDGVYVTVNNDANPGVISLTQTSLDKLNKEIPSAVSSFPDSVQYAKKTYVDSTFQTKNDMSAYATTVYVSGVAGSIYYTNILGLVDALSAKQDKLTFGYDENDAISSINSHKLAGAGGVTGDYYSASNPSGFINSTQAETQILAKNYITSGVSQLDNFYSKTDTSSKTELQTKFNSLLDYNVTAAAGIQVTTATDAGIKTFGISMTAEPVVTDTRLSGYNGVAAALDTNVSGLWNVGLTHDMLNTINGKLDTTDFNTYTATTAPSTYQPIGNYLSSNALEGYATTALLDTISSKIENDIPSIAGLATETDLQNVSAGVDYVSGALTGYQITGDYIVTGDILTATNNKLTGIKIGNTDYTIPTTDLTNYYTKSETSGATELSTEFGKYALKSEIPTVPTKVSDLTDSANYYKTTETSSKNELSTEFAKYLTTAQYNTDSATFALKSDLNGLVNSASVTTNDNYVMTNSGWKVLTLPGGGMTQVYHDTTLTGDGNADNSKLGLSQTAYNAITSVSSKLDTTAFSDVSGTFLTKSSADEDYAPKSITTNVNTLTAASASWNEVSAKLGTAQYANDSATFVTSSSNTITGTKQYALTTAGWAVVSTPTIPDITANNGISANGHTIGIDNTNLVTNTQYAWTTTGWASVETAYLPLTGGTVTGQLEVHGGSNFDSQFIKLTREGNSCGARIGLGSDTTNGTLALKTFNGQGQNTVQVNIKHNTNNNELIQVQKGGSDVGFLIPAVTSTTTAGLTNDGILHIILES